MSKSKNIFFKGRNCALRAYCRGPANFVHIYCWNPCCFPTKTRMHQTTIRRCYFGYVECTSSQLSTPFYGEDQAESCSASPQDHFGPDMATLRTMMSQSPCRVSHLPQSRVVPLLLEHAIRSPHATILWNQELSALEQDRNGVSVSLEDTGGNPSTLQCAYLIGADGASSTVRTALGVSWEGVVQCMRECWMPGWGHFQGTGARPVQFSASSAQESKFPKPLFRHCDHPQ